MSFRGLYNIPSYADFGQSLARGLLDSGLDLADALILLPNRRACRGLHTTFLRLREGEAMLMPRLVPMGDLSDEDAVGESIAGGIEDALLSDADLDLPEPWPRYLRESMLAELVARTDTSLRPDHVMALAQELARLMDQIETEGLDASTFETLVEEADYADHWGKSLRFLRILYQFWPAIEAEQGYISPARRRRLSVENQIKQWRLAPPDHPVIAAGSTGSIPSTRALLAALLDLPQGAVVLPGLDQSLPSQTWKEVGREVTHPQFGFAELLQACEAAPAQVQLWPGVEPTSQAARASILSRALLPPEATADAVTGWRALSEPTAGSDAAGSTLAEEVRAAFADVSLLELADDDEEAQTIALALREGLDRPAFISALVTPDRMLAQRVKGHLQRWGIDPDDSAGLRLEEVPAFKFARIVLDAVQSGFDHFALLALLHHPLCQLNLPEPVRQRGRAFLDLHVLRKSPSGNGLEPLFRQLDRVVTESEKSVQKAAETGTGTGKAAAHAAILAGAADTRQVLDALRGATQDLSEQALSASNWTTLDWVIGLIEALEALSQQSADSDANGDGAPEARVWTQSNADDVVRFFHEWSQALSQRDGAAVASSAASASAAVDLPVFRSLMERAAQGVSLRSPFVGHPRALILGGIEARLTSVDRIILGGLNEGTWPAETQPGPWMSRPMRRDFGLPSVERRIGLSAHDFCQAFGRQEVILTRAAIVDGGATVPSRLVKRLKAFLKIIKAEPVLSGAGQAFAAAAKALDTAERFDPAHRPRPFPPVAERPHQFSVTDVETWLANPYATYAKYCLRLRKLDPLGGRVDAAVRGTIIHDALETVLKDEDGAAQRALPLGDRVFAELVRRFEASGLPEAQFVLWRPRLRKMADWFASTQAVLQDNRRFHKALEVEACYAFDVGPRRYEIRCRADRVDQAADQSYVIVDYKSGLVPSGKQVETFEKPQLLLEGALIRKGAFKELDPETAISRLEYWSVNGRDEGGSLVIRPGSKTTPEEVAALVDGSWDKLRELLEEYQDPQRSFLARVVRKGDYIHLSRQDEWEGGHHDV